MTIYLAYFLFAASTWGAEPLTLTQAVHEALAGSPELRKGRAVLADAGLEEPLLLSNLDPKLEASYSSTNDRLPRAAPTFSGSYTHAQSWTTAVSQNTLLGTEARLAWSNERVRTPSLFRTLDPSVDSRVSLELRQPLLRYFWGRPDVARRRRARAGERASQERLRQLAEDLAAQAAKAYLELHHSRALLVIREAAVADARRLRTKHEEKSRYGIVEPSDLLQTEASLEASETELVIARAEDERAEHALLSALHRLDAEGPAPSLDGLGGAPTIPEAGSPSRLAEALARRGDLMAARSHLERMEWAARVERLDTLPDLALSASYQFAGLGTRYGEAWRDLDSLDHSEKVAGLSLSLPFGFKKERLTRRRAELAVEAARHEVRRLEESVRREVKDAELILGLARLRGAAGRRLAEIESRKLAAAEADFRRGRATTDLLVRFQADLRRAQAALLRAETDEAAAAVEFARAWGALLPALGLGGPLPMVEGGGTATPITPGAPRVTR